MPADKPFPIRLRKLKKYLERIAFNDNSVRSTTELIYKKLELVVLNDPECGPEYKKEIADSKSLKHKK